MARTQPGELSETTWQDVIHYSVLAGFLLSFGLFFIRAVFLNPEYAMKFPVYLPAEDLIGLDLNQMLSYCESFFINHDTPYIGNNLCPPLATVLFGPLLLLERSTAYLVITLMSVLAYVLTVLIIPSLIVKDKNRRSIIQLLFITGLFSYGFQFELVRGQFNMIAFSLAMLAVYFFHSRPRFRLLAYVLLTLSIQLKVFLAIFLVMVVDDWTDLRNNIKRFTGIILVNISLLFILGYQVFLDFIGGISKQALQPHFTMTNHSIKVFSELLFKKAGYRDLFLSRGMELDQIKNLAVYSNAIQLALQLFVIGCLFLVLVRAIKTNSNGLNPYLLSVCTILTLLIPSVSNDYKLPLIIGPLAVVLQIFVGSRMNARSALGSVLLVLVGGAAYSTTLFSYTNKPLILSNNLPGLLVVLLVVTIMSMFENKNLSINHEVAG